MADKPDIDMNWTFDAPRGEVWREWTAVMRGPKDQVIHWDGEYIEVSEPEKLSFSVSDQPGDDLYDLCTVELTGLAGTRTEMRFTQSGGHMPAWSNKHCETTRRKK